MRREYNKINLDFHQTFKPERACLSSLLVELKACSGKSAQEISKITGIPTGASSGKVVPSIYYLFYMGMITYELTDKQYYFVYTYLGKCVMEEDPGLMENLTLLLMHCMLSRKQSGAGLWGYIINELLPKYHYDIKRDNFEKELEMYYEKNVVTAPFNGTYAGIFNQLGILQINNGGYLMTSHSYNSEFIYLYSLVLYEYWDEWINGYSNEEKEDYKISDKEITSVQLSQIGYRLPFGWSEQEEYHSLEAMHDKGVIVLNRQMSPFIVRRITSKEEITTLLYSELC